MGDSLANEVDVNYETKRERRLGDLFVSMAKTHFN